MTAKDRALRAVNRRLERVGKKEQLRRSRQQPTLYAGQGEVQPLGAAGGIPATRGIPTTGGLAVGQPVAVAQGLVQGPQDAPQRADLEAVAAQLLRLLGEVRNNRGIQLFSGDPNDSGGPAYQAFDYQILYRTDTGALYYWEPGTATQAGEWVPILQVQVGTTIAPLFDGAIAVVPASTPVLYVGFNGSWVQLAGGGGGGNTVRFENFSPTTEQGVLAGDRWVNTRIDREWWWTGFAWKTETKIWFDLEASPLNTGEVVPGDLLVMGATSPTQPYTSLYYFYNAAWQPFTAFCYKPCGSDTSEPPPPPDVGDTTGQAT